jgi:Mg2+ and Co2+ transporter CorA
MNQDIRDMIETYEEVFKDNVWDGTNKIIWPAGDASGSSRQAHWNRRLALLRSGIDHEISKLRQVEELNERRMRVIKGLHDNLFSGTSVHESRRSVEQAEITVAQGRNIRLLTLVTIFFLPLTFVTSVFGMTNMPPRENYTRTYLVERSH